MRMFILFDYDFGNDDGIEFVVKEFEDIHFNNKYCYIFFKEDVFKYNTKDMYDIKIEKEGKEENE